MSAATATAAAPATAPARFTARPARWAFPRERGSAATVLVSAISAAFGVMLLALIGFLDAWMRALPELGDSDTVNGVLTALAIVLIGVAMYVGSIVTANTFATMIAGRIRQIALKRLIGASARSERSVVARQGLVIGLVGAVIGLVAGTVLAFGIQTVLESAFDVRTGYVPVDPVFVLPAIAVVLTTWAAAWAGSRRVLTVTPLEALSASSTRSHEDVRTRGRSVGAILLLVAGGSVIALGVLVGFLSPAGVLISFVGGVLSFTGVAVGAHIVIPPILRLTGRLLGRSTPARLAAENAMRYPERSSRMAIGVVMGVTLVMMFAVAAETMKAVFVTALGPVENDATVMVLDTLSGIMMALVAVSAVIAGVGLVNLLTIGIVQRRRELGLLRALGLSAPQVRRMVLLEAAHMTVTSLVIGLALGVFYGWIAAQSMVGSVRLSPDAVGPTIVTPSIPIVPLLVVIAATAALTLIAAVVPTRLATRVNPVEALAE